VNFVDTLFRQLHFFKHDEDLASATRFGGQEGAIVLVFTRDPLGGLPQDCPQLFVPIDSQVLTGNALLIVFRMRNQDLSPRRSP
jgi:hypothetical protein